MPLIHGKSKKAFEKNVKTEMDANPGKANKAQNLAIAYSIKRQAAKKKMSKGGMYGGQHEPADLNEHLTESSGNETHEQRYKLGGMVEGPLHSGKKSQSSMEIAGVTHTPKSEEDRKPSSSPLRQSYMSPPEDQFMGTDWTGGNDELSDIESYQHPSDEETMGGDWVDGSSPHSESVVDAIMRKHKNMKYIGLSDGGEVAEEEAHEYGPGGSGEVQGPDEETEEDKHDRELKDKYYGPAYGTGGEPAGGYYTGGEVGGDQVDIDENSRETAARPSPYDRMSMLAAKKEIYDDEQLSPQPMDSNEDSREIDSDTHDHIDQIRKRIKRR